MHELSLASEIIDLVQPRIPEGEQLASVQITVGLLAGICTDSLRFCFDELVKLAGHPDAKLEINMKPALYRCLDCEHEYETETTETACPKCNSLVRTLLGGSEFSVDCIEV